MKIRKKVLFLISLTLIGLISVVLGTVSTIILNSFRKLEAEETTKNLQRLQGFIDEEIQELNAISKDWVRWDDTYFFVQNKDPIYIENNIYPDIFDNLKLNLFLLYNKNTDIVLNSSYALGSQQLEKVKKEILLDLEQKDYLLKFTDDRGEIKGFIILDQDLYFIVLRPVLDSASQGPSQGTIVMARVMDHNKIKELENYTKLSINIYFLDELSEDLKSVYHDLDQNKSNAKSLVKIKNKNLISGFILLKDIENKSIALLAVDSPRDIYEKGNQAVFFLVFSLIIVGFIFVILMLVLMDRLILYRLTILDQDLKTIGNTNNLNLRVHIQGQDELTHFAHTINWMLDELQKEKDKTEKLLLNILPETIAEQLKQSHDIIARDFECVTILFADIVGFTTLSGRLSPLELVDFLNQLFSDFDYLVEELGLEKIKTIGDAYMVASGLPEPRTDHAEAIANMALEMNKVINQVSLVYNENFKIRIGINTGKVVAGVIGKKRLIYDLWGDAVNIASRMESSGEPGKIQVTESTYKLLQNKYVFTKRGTVNVKGKGEMVTYWLESIA